MLEKFKAAHAGQTQIEHQTAGVRALWRFEELFRRGERLDLETNRHQEIPHGSTQGSIVVDDGDHPRLLLAHTIRLGRPARRVYPTLVWCRHSGRSSRRWVSIAVRSMSHNGGARVQLDTSAVRVAGPSGSCSTRAPTSRRRAPSRRSG